MSPEEAKVRMASVRCVPPAVINTSKPHPDAMVAVKVADFIQMNGNNEPLYWPHADQTSRIGTVLLNLDEVRPDVLYLSMRPSMILTEEELHEQLVAKYGDLNNFHFDCLDRMKQVYYGPWAWDDDVFLQVTNVQTDSFLQVYLGMSLEGFQLAKHAEYVELYPSKSAVFHANCVKKSLDYPCIAALMDLFLRNEISPNRVISRTLRSFVIGLGKRYDLDCDMFSRHMTCGEAWDLVVERELFAAVLINYTP